MRRNECPIDHVAGYKIVNQAGSIRTYRLSDFMPRTTCQYLPRHHVRDIDLYRRLL
jgi:hypothetical protein